MDGLLQESIKEKENYLFCGMAVLLCLRHIMQLLGFSRISSVLLAILYVLTALFSVGSLWQKICTKQTRVGMLYFLLEVGIFFYVIGMLLLEYPAYLQQSFVFLLMFPLLVCHETVCVSEKNGKLYFRFLTVVGILLSILAFVPSQYKNGILYLYTTNANQAGLLYMSVFLGIFMYCRLYKQHLAIYAVLVGLLYGCWQTGSRTAIVVCIFAVFFYYWLQSGKRKTKRWLNLAMITFIGLPFLSTALVQWLGKDFVILGESAWTGREKMWPEILEKLSNTPLEFKIDQIIENWYGEGLGTHNTWMSIAWDYSVPVAVVFLLSLFHFGRSLLLGNNKRHAILVTYFIGGLLHMSFEASLINGALDYSLYFLLPLFVGSAIIKKRECFENEEKTLDKCDCPDLQNGTIS